MTMTSATAIADIQAARTHVDAALPRLTGVPLKDAKAILTSLAKLIVKLGGS